MTTQNEWLDELFNLRNQNQGIEVKFLTQGSLTAGGILQEITDVSVVPWIEDDWLYIGEEEVRSILSDNYSYAGDSLEEETEDEYVERKYREVRKVIYVQTRVPV